MAPTKATSAAAASATTTTTTPSLANLEQAALHILRLIRDTPGLANTKLAVIGDLAVCKYLPQSRRAESIDFVISKSSSPGRVRKEIVGHPMSPLVEKAGAVFYQHTSGWQVEVKLAPDWVCPYLPSGARPVRDDVDSLPYISLEDLIVFKTDACGLRECDASRRREASEAAALLALASKHTPLVLPADKLDRVEQALEDVVEFCGPEHDKAWWQRQLGQTPDRQRSAQEIVSDIADHTFSSPTTPTSSSSSIYSSMSRQSSYASSVSSHSTSSSTSSLQSMDAKNGRPRKMSVTAKSPRHKRHTSTGGSVSKATSKATLDVAMQQMSLERPASPGMALTNRI